MLEAVDQVHAVGFDKINPPDANAPKSTLPRPVAVTFEPVKALSEAALASSHRAFIALTVSCFWEEALSARRSGLQWISIRVPTRHDRMFHQRFELCR
jgi:hypothetical protein